MEGKTRYWRLDDRRIIPSKSDLTPGGYVEVTREDYLAWREWFNDNFLVIQPVDITGTQRNKLKRLAKKRGVAPRELAGDWLGQLIDKAVE